MKKLYLDRFIPGMRVARTIYAADGRVLLQEGSELKPSYLEQLKRRGITVVYVRDRLDEEFPEAVPEDVISEQTRVETTRICQQLMEDARARYQKEGGRGLYLDADRVRDQVSRIISELLENRDAVVHLTDIRGVDDYTFHHSVNVCVLTVLAGMSLGYDEARLRDLGVGALLHDIGKIAVDQEILKKPGPLSPEEFEVMKRHTTAGFEILWGQENLSVLSAHVAYQHHEREDGSGYPRGLAGREIHEFAKLCAVADVYDALVADRPYRRAFLPSEAHRMMISNPGLYDPRSTQAMFLNIALYPLGTLVRLNTGEVGLVIRVRRGMPGKPVVRVVLDVRGRRLPIMRDVDLLRESAVSVAGAAGELQRVLDERLRTVATTTVPG